LRFTSLPKSFKNLSPDIEIYMSYDNNRNINNNNYMGYANWRDSLRNYNNTDFVNKGRFTTETRDSMIKSFRPYKPKIVSNNTELFNSEFLKTNKLPPKNKRVYINTNSNVKNNGELRRLYNMNGINQYMRGRTRGHLHGGNFRMNQLKKLTYANIVIRKNDYLRNIKSRLLNSSLTKFNQLVNRIKNNLPSTISRTEVNNVIRSVKPQLLQKIFNKLKNSPSNNRVRIMNTMKNRGLINQNDITVMKKKLLGPNFVRNSKKPSPTTTTTRKLMNSNNARKSPYI